MTQDSPKICPNCQKKDLTSFSTCRFCGVSYNVRPKPLVIMDERIICGILAIVLLIGAIIYYVQLQHAAELKRFEPIRRSILVSRKPRFIELYAPWCGACRAYAPIVGECKSKYFGKIDFRQMDITSVNDPELMHALSFTVIPTTYLFDRHGNAVAKIEGSLSHDVLDRYLQSLDSAQ